MACQDIGNANLSWWYQDFLSLSQNYSELDSPEKFFSLQASFEVKLLEYSYLIFSPEIIQRICHLLLRISKYLCLQFLI
jgi:hypothetical protein